MNKTSIAISIATIAIAVSTLTTNATNQNRNDGSVVFLGDNQWMPINPMEEGITWDCFNGGQKCVGVLKPNADKNANGYYDDNEVYYQTGHRHYEPIN